MNLRSIRPGARCPEPVASLRARSVSRRIADALSRPASGQVLAAFERSCYVDLDGQIVALVAPDLLNGPLNIVIESPNGTFQRLAAGTRVSSAEIALDGAAIWDAGLRPWRRPPQDLIRTHFGLLRRLLAEASPAGGLARVAIEERGQTPDRTPVEDLALPALVTLSKGFARGDRTLISRAAGALVGLGPGLTPSGDDILVGALLAAAVWPTPAREAIRDAIAAVVPGRTTRISAAYLDAAARGEASEAWHTLLAVLPDPEPAPVIGAARRLMAFGETSGSDMLAGFVLVVNALLA